MKHVPVTLACVLLILLVSATDAEAQTPPTEWVGEFVLASKATPIHLHVGTSEATADLPLDGVRGVPVRVAKLDGPAVHIEMARPTDVVVLDGRLQGNTASGTATDGNARGTFTLVRLMPIDRALNDEYAGSYQLGRGRVIDLGPMDEQGGLLVFLDQKTLREGGLYPLSATEFVSGPALVVNYPFEIRVTFTRDRKGAVSGLVWKEAGARPVVGRKIAPHRREEVTVVNGDVTLKGILTLPAGRGPHPAIVFAHGSGAATRNVGMWNLFFVRLGYAVLSLDKRGAGESTGDWHLASMDDLASDWLAGVEMLKRRADIDSKRIGVHGSSQGGWTGPRMAARSKDIAFLIVRAGSGVGVMDTMIHEIEWSVREAGFSEADAKDAGAVSRQVFTLAVESADFEQIDRVAAPARAKPWGQHAWPLFMSKDGWGIPWARLNAGHEAEPTLRQVTCPVLWFLGDNDHNVPTVASERRLREIFAKAGNTDVAVKVLRNANHGFLESATGNNSEFPRLKRMAPGYWDTMERWLAERLGPPRSLSRER